MLCTLSCVHVFLYSICIFIHLCINPSIYEFLPFIPVGNSFCSHIHLNTIGTKVLLGVLKMAPNAQKIPLSANLQYAMIQLMQQLGQNLPQSTVVQQSAAFFLSPKVTPMFSLHNQILWPTVLCLEDSSKLLCGQWQLNTLLVKRRVRFKNQRWHSWIYHTLTHQSLYWNLIFFSGYCLMLIWIFA